MSEAAHIIVDKIIRKEGQGNPTFDIVPEGIRVDLIRSFRRYKQSNKTDNYSSAGITEVTVLYMKGDAERDRTPEIHIAENFFSFSKRIGASEPEKEPEVNVHTPA